MIARMDQPGTVQARITVRPTWVGLLDFVTRFPGPLGGVSGRRTDERRITEMSKVFSALAVSVDGYISG